MAFRLRDRILGWSIASTLVIVLAVLVLVDSFFRTTIRGTLEENLVSGARLAGELRGSRVDGWIAEVARMALEPTLRAAVTTGDAATIRQILEGPLGRDADWLAVVDAEGGVLAHAGPAPLDRIASDGARLLAETAYYDSGDLWVQDGGLVDVGASSILFGDLRLGVLLAGDRIGQARADEVATFTAQRVAYRTRDGSTVVDSALDRAHVPELVALPWDDGGPTTARPSEPLPGPVRPFRLGDEDFLGTALELRGADGQPRGSLLVFRSLDAALEPARRLRLYLIAIGGAGILVGLAFSLALSRSVTDPLGALLAETERLGSGDLEGPIRAMREDEIGRLARGFERMRVSLREARAELIRRERLAAVGRAASALVHDFAQPVTVISARTEFLAQGIADEEGRKEEIGAIRESVRRLQGMMREVLEFARGEVRTERAPASVAMLLDEVARQVQPLAEEAGITVAVEPGYPGLWTLDYQRTGRALGNLVRNAAAALRGPGGTVRLRSARVDGRLRLEVEDDGPGIPQEVRATLFEPFVTHGKREGTGLGLAIVKNIAESQGGTVTFETSPQGTMFALELPASHGGEARA